MTVASYRTYSSLHCVQLLSILARLMKSASCMTQICRVDYWLGLIIHSALLLLLQV